MQGNKYILLIAIIVFMSNSILASSVHISTVQASPGDESVEVVISLKNDNPISGTEFSLEYNHSVMELDTILVGSRLSAFSDAGYYEYSYGKVAGIFFDITALSLPTDSGDIFRLYFNINSDAWIEFAAVDITEIIAVTDNMEIEAINIENGGIELQGFYVCGDVAEPLDGLVNLLDILFLISYLYGNPPGNAPDPIEAGDVNFNGESIVINLIDILYLIDFIYGNPHGPAPDCAGHQKRSLPLAPVDTIFIASNIKNGKSTISIDSPIDIFGIEIKLRSSDSSEIVLTNQSKVFDLFYRQENATIKAGMLNPKEKQLLPKGKNTLMEASGEVEILDVLGVDASLNPIHFISSSTLLPKEFELSQNYPNPFNPTTTIKFALPVDADVRLEIYNILGQRVTTLINERLVAGYHSVLWDGHNSSGEEVASGVYFYRIITDKFVKSKKMVLLK